MDGLEVREEDDALLLVGVGAGDDGGAVLGGAGVVGEVGHVGGDVEEVGGFDDVVVLQLLSVPHAGDAAEDVEGGLVGGVFVGLGAASGGHAEELHVDGVGADGLGGDGGRGHQALLALGGGFGAG